MTERIFEIKTLKSVIVKNLFEVIKPYIKETNIVINKDCIKISTLDTSKVSLTYVKLDATKFESYSCEKPVVLGIDTNTFFKLFEYSVMNIFRYEQGEIILKILSTIILFSYLLTFVDKWNISGYKIFLYPLISVLTFGFLYFLAIINL